MPLSGVWGWARGENFFSCPSFFAAGTIGCCAASLLVLAWPSSSGERGLILSGCVWFLCGSIDPVAAYLRGRAPCCLFWRREGSRCEVALTISTEHQSSPRPSEQNVLWILANLTIHVCICARPDKVLVMCLFACMRGMIIKHSIAVRKRAAVQSLELQRAW